MTVKTAVSAKNVKKSVKKVSLERVLSGNLTQEESKSLKNELLTLAKKPDAKRPAKGTRLGIALDLFTKNPNEILTAEEREYRKKEREDLKNCKTAEDFIASIKSHSIKFREAQAAEEKEAKALKDIERQVPGITKNPMFIAMAEKMKNIGSISLADIAKANTTKN